MLKQGAEDTFAAKILQHIDTLKPPEIAIAPVAPFISDHDLANDFPIHFGDIVQAFGWISQDGRYTFGDTVRIEVQLLRFFSQSQVKFSDDRSIR